MNNDSIHDERNPLSALTGKKILFANFPGDGHFNPLTGLAAQLKSLGCDVRWYSSEAYAEKIKKLKLVHYSFKSAMDLKAFDLKTLFAEREKIKGAIKRFNHDLVNVFILRGPEYYADIEEIYKDFPFEVLVCDCAFTGIPFVTDLMKIPVVSVGVFPLMENSKDLAPGGMGMTPSYSFAGKIKQGLLRLLSDKVLFRKSNRILHKQLDKYGIKHHQQNTFDFLVKKSTIFLQSGTPGFEYYRSDLGKNIRFIGSLLPHRFPKQRASWFDARLNRYDKIVIVTQGTVESNTNKIIVPTLEAFKNSDTLVIATTGGNGTNELKDQYPQANLIIEDFISFEDIMPYADAYITNGGYGGIMLGIENELPLVVAGVHEGKNEICARVGYFKLGINLKTETPHPQQIKEAVEELFHNNVYKENVIKLGMEFKGYNPNELFAYYVKETLRKTGRLIPKREEMIY